ncbi:hypothetical protein O181_120013 [Austropuccinia psidii MF-1]|uniref:Uncharacterized protein n=1 Tax=Austropuccinia psidii MF-1 TaxID=1389203 RepID=A0A9Q3KF89_9BASI|nr:hypothetical protein [Austropuccinia psidii MF-1]
MSSFVLSIYINDNGHEVITILHGGYCYTIHCIHDLDLNSNATRILLPTSIMPLSGSTLAWPLSNNPLPMTNSHHSPPALVGNLASQSVVTVTANSLSNSISISAMISSNSNFELHQLFDVFNCLFYHYCRDFYNYIHNHPNNVGDYGSLSDLQSFLQALVEVLNKLAE